MSDVNWSKLKKLLKEKRYSEIVLDIETSTTEKTRSSALLNLLGICRASQKGKTDRDIKYSLNDFENAFYKDNFGEISLESLCNHIRLCDEMGREESDLVNNLLTSEKMYIQAEKKYSKNIKYLTYGVDLYKYLLKHDKRISKIEEVINLKSLDETYGTLYITSQMYLNNWDQKNFKEFQKEFTKLFKPLKANKLANSQKSKKKIKIGFLSPDFKKSHSITYFIQNLIKDLKQTNFETYGLSLLNIKYQDETTEKFKNLFDQWIDLEDKSNQEIVNTIQNLSVDILIDLAGLWSANRASIFNTRICPLQITWLGFNNSTGLKEIDYILADVNTVKNEEKDYGTKIYKLPEIWNSHCGFEYKRVYNDLPFKKNNYFTFGSFNNFMKINDEVLDTWIKILKKIENSKIILKSSLFVCEDVIKKKFEEEGLINSLVIIKKTKRNNFLSHLNIYDKIDLCLDTFPFTGVTTTFEALWKNVPVITKTGLNFNSRCGESILKNANMSNFIATSCDEYIEKAVFYANNIDKLENARKKLFDRVLESPLFDTKSFSIAFYKALKNMLDLVNKNYK